MFNQLIRGGERDISGLTYSPPFRNKKIVHEKFKQNSINKTATKICRESLPVQPLECVFSCPLGLWCSRFEFLKQSDYSHFDCLLFSLIYEFNLSVLILKLFNV